MKLFKRPQPIKWKNLDAGLSYLIEENRNDFTPFLFDKDFDEYKQLLIGYVSDEFKKKFRGTKTLCFLGLTYEPSEKGILVNGIISEIYPSFRLQELGYWSRVIGHKNLKSGEIYLLKKMEDGKYLPITIV